MCVSVAYGHRKKAKVCHCTNTALVVPHYTDETRPQGCLKAKTTTQMKVKTDARAAIPKTAMRLCASLLTGRIVSGIGKASSQIRALVLVEPCRESS